VSALNATKRDLAEFVSVLGSDTKAAVKGASDNINKILVQPPSTSAEGEEEEHHNQRNSVPPPAASATPYDRCQAELFAAQNSSDTYLHDPPQGLCCVNPWSTGHVFASLLDEACCPVEKSFYCWETCVALGLPSNA
jgi:hypothetical protein